MTILVITIEHIDLDYLVYDYPLNPLKPKRIPTRGMHYTSSTSVPYFAQTEPAMVWVVGSR